MRGRCSGTGKRYRSSVQLLCWVCEAYYDCCMALQRPMKERIWVSRSQFSITSLLKPEKVPWAEMWFWVVYLQFVRVVGSGSDAIFCAMYVCRVVGQTSWKPSWHNNAVSSTEQNAEAVFKKTQFQSNRYKGCNPTWPDRRDIDVAFSAKYIFLSEFGGPTWMWCQLRRRVGLGGHGWVCFFVMFVILRLWSHW